MWSMVAGRRAVAAARVPMKLRDDNGDPEPMEPQRENARRTRAEAGFDRWLRDRLHAMYDPVLRERVPEEFETLLDRIARRPPAGPDKP
jgi:CRISPR/Cas system type I-B associated protein Csh2 (Cas7 group RAMP superfamily)